MHFLKTSSEVLLLFHSFWVKLVQVKSQIFGL